MEKLGWLCVDGKKYKKIICVITHKGNADKVVAIKATWLAKPLPSDYLVLFVYGNDGGVVPRIEGDMLFLSAKDSWANLPNKIYDLYSYCANHFEFEYLFKIDDDCCVRRKALIAYPGTMIDYAGIFHGDITASSPNRLVGARDVDPRAVAHEIRQDHIYQGDLPRAFACGPLYVLSYRVIQMIAAKPAYLYEDCNLEVGLEDVMVGKAVQESGLESVVFDDWKLFRLSKYFSKPYYLTDLNAQKIRAAHSFFYLIVVKRVLLGLVDKLSKKIKI